MSRWEPNASGRLQKAALELYAERGFENTTVAEIAERAGLTERTFFRYFADKREVLFYGSGALTEFLVRKVGEAPASLPALQVIAWALASAGTEIFEERREFSRRRQSVIAANLELQERELVKFATLASGLAHALDERGVVPATASLAAETAMVLFKFAFERWTKDVSGARTLAEIIRESVNELESVTTGRPAAGD